MIRTLISPEEFYVVKFVAIRLTSRLVVGEDQIIGCHCRKGNKSNVQELLFFMISDQ